MRLLLKLKDYCYYEFKGEVVWIKNKKDYLERRMTSRITYLRNKGEL